MNISPASSSLSAVSLAYISNPDDALDLSNATQSELTDKLSDAISARISIAGALVNKLERLNLIVNHLKIYGTGAFKPVTADSLSATPKTTEALKSLFNNNGPSLGSSIEDANATIAELKELGISFDAPKLTPLLIDSQDKTGKSTGQNLVWVGDNLLALLKVLNPVKSTIYPDANEYKYKISDDITIVYTSFDKNAKISPSQTDINSAIEKITILAKSINAEISAAMDKVSDDFDKLEKIISDNSKERKNQSQQINALANQQKEQVLAIINKIRILKIEREASLQKQDNKIGPEISSIAKNASDRVENISNIDADFLSRSASGADANDDVRRFQQSLTGLAAGPNTNAPDNRIPV